MSRVVLAVLTQTDEGSMSAEELEKFVRQQLKSGKISDICSLEKVTVLD